ncbi:MAG: protein-L-isoaspartate O-methyltransferase family protein [Gammaproteobacteria bacterium]
MNFEQARLNMVEQQRRPWEVLDQRVLDTILESPRDSFVPDDYQGIAYSDTRIPIGHGETMMSPKVEGRLLQALDIQAHERGLEIGTGTGYLTSLLARFASHVTSVDIYEDFTAAARHRLAMHGVSNVDLLTANACEGVTGTGPFDFIAVTGAMATENPGLREQLAIGGRLFVVIGKPPIMEARLIERTSDSVFAEQTLFETDLKYLVGAEAPAEFSFD